MKWFTRKKPQNMYDKAMENLTPILINSYRKEALKRGCAPTSKTSNQQIVDIYQLVLSKYNEAAAKKGEIIPAKTLNYIALQFMNIFEISGESFMVSHLNYELLKYHMSGLRKEYVGKELALF